MSSTQLDEHQDVVKELEAKFHCRIVNLKEDLDNLQTIHHNLLHVSRQKEAEYNNTVSSLNENIKLLEQDYNELLLIHNQKAEEYNETIASYEDKQRQCDLTIASYVQRELANYQTIDSCKQNVQRLTDALVKQNKSLPTLRQQNKVTSSGYIATGSVWTLFFIPLFLTSDKYY